MEFFFFGFPIHFSSPWVHYLPQFNELLDFNVVVGTSTLLACEFMTSVVTSTKHQIRLAKARY